jgi:phage shock protein PspC (stress-responsive transcriptional regulator)
MDAQEKEVALPLRSHTILGVCEALGEDFGFNPIFLRVPFAASVLISPMWAVVSYLALGVLVLATRLIFPKAKVVPTNVAAAEAPAAAANSQDELAKAA